MERTPNGCSVHSLPVTSTKTAKWIAGLLCLALCMLPAVSSAQKALFTWGEKSHSAAAETDKVTYFPGGADAYYIFYERTNEKGILTSLLLEKVSNSKVTNSEKLLRQQDGFTYSHLALLPLKSGFAQFLVRTDKTAKTFDLVVRTVNANADADDDEKVIVTLPIDKKGNKERFFVAVSPDRNKLAVVTSFPATKTAKEKLEIRVFDNNLDPGEPIVLEEEKPALQAPAYQALVNNEGNVYLLKEEHTKNEGPVHSVLLFDADNLVAEEVFTLDNPFHILEYGTEVNPAGELVLAGTVTTENEPDPAVSPAIGLFYFRINAQAQVTKRTEDFEKDGANIRLRHFQQHNGNIYLVLNRIVSKQDKIAVGKEALYSTSYETQGIYAFCLDNTGTLKWEHHHDYKHKSVDDGGNLLGIFAAVENDEMFLLFNDFEYKHNGQKYVEVTGPIVSSRIPVLLHIDATGLASVKGLFGSGTGERKFDEMLIPAHFCRLSDGKYAVSAMYGSSRKLGTVELIR